VAGTCSTSTGCSNPVATGVNCPTNGPACQQWYPDCDQDGFGDSQKAPIWSCSAPLRVPTCSSGFNGTYVNNNRDCCDIDPGANPDQTNYSIVPDACDGSFDWNCDGVETLQSDGPSDCDPPNLACPQVSGCPNPTLPPDCVDGIESETPALCGQYWQLFYATCAPSQTGTGCDLIAGTANGGTQACL
jgi:hypothetical protein